MNQYKIILEQLQVSPSTWLITGCAGFIGSNLVEALLTLNQKVIGVDNFATGHHTNLEEVKSLVTNAQWQEFKFIEGDIAHYECCLKICEGVDYVLHQAALGSVPRSIKDPIASNHANVTGHLNMLFASKETGVKSFTYAASSSTYGDHPALPKVEENIGNPLSPYAVTKLANELYSQVFSLNYDFHAIGLRYFNVFGKRQDPQGAYAAVIPKWINSMICGDEIYINGDGSTSRDFCYIDNVVQANILAATHLRRSQHNVFNVAVGDRTSLIELFNLMRESLLHYDFKYALDPCFRSFRDGDVLHSQAQILHAKTILGYEPEFDIRRGLMQTVKWYLQSQLSNEFLSND